MVLGFFYCRARFVVKQLSNQIITDQTGIVAKRKINNNGKICKPASRDHSGFVIRFDHRGYRGFIVTIECSEARVS